MFAGEARVLFKMIIQKGEGVDGLSYIKQPDEFGPKWTLRFIFVPGIPPPEWFKKPIFSG